MTHLSRLLVILLLTASFPLSASKAASITTLASITGNTDAATPNSELIAVGKELYGTASAGGAYGRGAVFRINPMTGKLYVVYSFTGGTDGAAPGAALTLVGGSLYGTTTLGGTIGAGTLFRIDLANSALTPLYAFPPPPSTTVNVFSALLPFGGKLYGTSFFGGTASNGSVFSFNPATGTVSTVFSFPAGKNGNYPQGLYPHGALVNVNGQLYGTTEQGGPHYGGTVFRVNPVTGTETVVHGFTVSGSQPDTPMAGLLRVGNTLYGTTSDLYSSGYGTVFAIDIATGTETTLADLTAVSALNPQSSLVELGGLLYGTSFSLVPPGGYAQSGTVFSVNPQTGATQQVYAFFGNPDGGNLVAGLLAFNGMLYGTAPAGGGNPRDTPISASEGRGTVFAVNPATATETTLHDFVGTAGGDFLGTQSNPAMTRAGAWLYGVSAQGGANGDGSLFRLDTETGTLTTLYSFTGKNDGGAPLASLVNVGGTLYGATTYGTAFTGGSPFSYDPAKHALKSIIALPVNGSSSGNPTTALTWANGLFYDDTGITGPQQNGDGAVFSLDFASGKETILHTFTCCGAGGADPLAPLLNVDGVLYGTTAIGGTQGGGTVFSFDPATGGLSTLYNFAGDSDGYAPRSGLIYVGGMLYGTTDGDANANGETNGEPGSIFSLDPTTGIETTLFDFPANGANGQQARGLAVINGTIYGTTLAGGAANQGTIFALRVSNRHFETLYSFSGLADGGTPAGGLTEVAGQLYGITSQGGAQNAGTIFKLNP